MKRPLVVIACALVVASTVADAAAVEPIATVGAPAQATLQAESMFAPVDVVSIYQRSNALSPDVGARAISAIENVRGAWALGRGASVGMARVSRNGATIQQAPDGFAYPMSTTALPPEAVGALMGRNVSGILAQGQVVMGATTANLRGAKAGDVVDVVAANGSVVSFTIGMVASDAVVGGTELLMSTAEADHIGVTVDGRIVLWGFSSRAALDQAISGVGLDGRADTRVRRSWDPSDPDSTLGMAATKALLGEFAYRVNPGGIDITITGDWVAAHLPPDREPLNPGIGIRARCNLAIRSDLQAALTEVNAAGLAGAIDVVNANTYGGCFYPRFNRLSGSLGFISRHAWAQALDTNTVSNAQGRVPQMNCDVVRILRKHNFAWGGNFLTPDGMHFEWVGQRRDLLQYPSTYCPNLPVAPGANGAPAQRPTAGNGLPPSRATLFADDGWANGE